MPSAHEVILCRKELLEKAGVKVRFFFGLKSVHTTDFYVASSSEKKSDRYFLGPKVSAHGLTFYRSYCL